VEYFAAPTLIGGEAARQVIAEGVGAGLGTARRRHRPDHSQGAEGRVLAVRSPVGAVTQLCPDETRHRPPRKVADGRLLAREEAVK
jgi:hypothetical protein